MTSFKSWESRNKDYKATEGTWSHAMSIFSSLMRWLVSTQTTSKRSSHHLSAVMSNVIIKGGTLSLLSSSISMLAYVFYFLLASCHTSCSPFTSHRLPSSFVGQVWFRQSKDITSVVSSDSDRLNDSSPAPTLCRDKGVKGNCNLKVIVAHFF